MGWMDRRSGWMEWMIKVGLIKGKDAGRRKEEMVVWETCKLDLLVWDLNIGKYVHLIY